MHSVISAVYQCRYVDEVGFVSMRVRDIILVARMSVPMRKRMARRSRRGVGMKGTGRSMMKIVFGISKASVVAVWAW